MRENSKKLCNHIASNHSAKTREVIKYVPEGGNWKDLPAKYQNIRSYSNTWRRLDSKKPSVTIDTGHRHHFHYKANRVPTVRESARIQSFKDDFVFCCAKTSQFKQVGNAVPPLLGKAIAKEVKKML
jgi:DNA (cytosine-5)-methyltransferase 1